MEMGTQTLSNEEDVIQRSRVWDEKDLDRKGNYPDGLPPTDPSNLWSLYDAPHYQKTTAVPRIGLFSRSKGTRKVFQHSDGHTYTLFVYGPDGGCVVYEKIIGSISDEAKAALVEIVKDCPHTMAKTSRMENARAARILLRLPPEKSN